MSDLACYLNPPQNTNDSGAFLQYGSPAIVQFCQAFGVPALLAHLRTAG